MSDLFIKNIKQDHGFLSWKEHDGHQVIVNLQQVTAIEMGPRAERPGLRVGAEMYFPPLSYEEAASVWMASNTPAKISAGFHLTKSEN